MNNNPIGILDSGIGGLSVLLEIKKLLPNESLVYVGDSENVPYSTKTAEEVFNLSSKLVEVLLENKAKLVVVACNTITVSCIDKLREKFKNIPIVGTVPVLKTAVNLTKNGRIGVFSTKTTSQSTYLKNLIQKFSQGKEITNIGSDVIAHMIEKGELGKELKVELEKELQPFKEKDVGVLALGCTHYPLVKSTIEKIMGDKTQVIDSGAAIARQVKRILEENKALSNSKRPQYAFYALGNAKLLKEWVNRLDLEGDVKLYGF